MRVLVITQMPSIHQIALFDAIHARNEVDLRVVYLRRASTRQGWKVPRSLQIKHEATFLREIQIGRGFYLSPGLALVMRRTRPDIVVLGQYASIAAQEAMYLCSALGIPWVLWAEAPGMQWSESPLIGNSAVRRLLRGVALFPVRRFAAAVWAIGRLGETGYRARMPESTRVFSLPYFSDLDLFHGIERSSLPGNPPVFVFAGQLVPRKGFDVLLSAVEVLAGKERDFRVLVAGSGPLEELARNAPESVRSRLDLLGYRQVEEMSVVYASGDVLVFPTRYDGWGMVAIEGMASGMPIIGTHMASSCLEAIDPGVNGVLLRRVDGECLAESMRWFLDNPAEIRRMGASARQTSLKYTPSVGATRFGELVALTLE